MVHAHGAEPLMLSTVEKVRFQKSIELSSQIPGEDLAQIALISSEEPIGVSSIVFGSASGNTVLCPLGALP